MVQIIGKPKDDEPIKEMAKEAVVQAVKKKYPFIPRRQLRKKIDRIDKKLSKGLKRGVTI